jgi:pimeloyl-CoA synthetase
MDRQCQIRLPKDHPVFTIPRGERSKKVKEWINLGIGIEGKMDRLQEKVNSIESSLDDIKNLLLQGIPSHHKEEKNSKAPENTRAALNRALDDFLDL